jgi:hypothetical protein
MKNVIITIGKKIEKAVNYLITLESDYQTHEMYLIIRIQIVDRSYYFGPFPSVQYAEQWLLIHEISHLKHEMIDVYNPGLSRQEWPF